MPEAAPPAENPNISKSVVVKATDMDAEMVEAAVRAYEEFRDMARTTGSSGTSAAPVSYTHLTLPTNREV